jgi:hypothetical protein
MVVIRRPASARWSRSPPTAPTASTIPINGVTNPTGLAFDPAEDLYILDGTANTITVVSPTNERHHVPLVDL